MGRGALLLALLGAHASTAEVDPTLAYGRVARDPDVQAAVDALGGGDRGIGIGYTAQVPGTADLVRAEASFPTAYRPTAACWADADTLCVAGVLGASGTESAAPGRSTTDRVVIEAWDFAATTLEAGADGAAEIRPGARLATRTVLAPEAAHPSVRCISRVLGGAEPALLVLLETGELATLALGPDAVAGAGGGPALVPQAGPAPGAPLSVPALARPWSHLQARAHVALGAAYVLRIPTCVAAPDDVTLILWDHDADGRLDEAVEYDAQTWAARALHLPSSWVEE